MTAESLDNRGDVATQEQKATSAEVSVSTSARSTRRWTVPMLRLVIVVALLCAWEFSSGRLIDEFFISRPTAIVKVWWQWMTDGTLWYHASSTFLSAALSLVIGGVMAILVGYLLGASSRLGEIFEPFITAIYSLPKLALVPLLVMWFGIGRQLQVAVGALVVFFLMFYNTFFGIKDVDRSLIDAVRIIGGSRWDIATKVRLPSALVWVVAGLKLSAPQALVAVVVAEILASNRGLGHLVSLNSGQFNSAGTFAALLTLLVIGIAVDRILGLLTRRALMWKQEGQHNR